MSVRCHLWMDPGSGDKRSTVMTVTMAWPLKDGSKVWMCQKGHASLLPPLADSGQSRAGYCHADVGGEMSGQEKRDGRCFVALSVAGKGREARVYGSVALQCLSPCLHVNPVQAAISLAKLLDLP